MSELRLGPRTISSAALMAKAKASPTMTITITAESLLVALGAVEAECDNWHAAELAAYKRRIAELEREVQSVTGLAPTR